MIAYVLHQHANNYRTNSWSAIHNTSTVPNQRLHECSRYANGTLTQGARHWPCIASTGGWQGWASAQSPKRTPQHHFLECTAVAPRATRHHRRAVSATNKGTVWELDPKLQGNLTTQQRQLLHRMRDVNNACRQLFCSKGNFSACAECTSLLCVYQQAACMHAASRHVQ
jgi:hypothetical protein